MRGPRSPGQGDAEQEGGGDLGRDRRRKVVGDRDHGPVRQGERLAAQDPGDPGPDVAHVGGARGQRLVGEAGHRHGRVRRRVDDRRRGIGPGGDAGQRLVDDRGIGGQDGLRLEDARVVRPAGVADPRRERLQLRLRGDRGGANRLARVAGQAA